MSPLAAPRRSAAQWQARLVAQERRDWSRTWWDAWPWNGTIPDEEVQRVVNYCLAKFGFYSPINPLRPPDVLAEMGFDVAVPPPPPRLSCQGCGGELPADRWLRCYACGPLVMAEPLSEKDAPRCGVSPEPPGAYRLR